MRISQKVPLQNADVVTLGDQRIRFDDNASGSVVLTDGGLDLEGTVVVSTEELLAAAKAQEDTWDNMEEKAVARRPSPRLDESGRILKQNQILAALSQASMALISNRPLRELLEFILELAFKVIRAERGVLMLTTSAGGLEVEAVRTTQGSSSTEEIAFSRTIADKVVTEKVSILTNNALSDPRFQAQHSIISLGIRSAMCVPLWHDDTVTGLIYVDSLRRENSFTQDDLTLLTSLANVAAIKLENAKLLEEMIEKKRMERELELAGEIQQGLLPSDAPRISGWDSGGNQHALLHHRRRLLRFHRAPQRPGAGAGRRLGKGDGGGLDDDGAEGDGSLRERQ